MEFVVKKGSHIPVDDIYFGTGFQLVVKIICVYYTDCGRARLTTVGIHTNTVHIKQITQIITFTMYN